MVVKGPEESWARYTWQEMISGLRLRTDTIGRGHAVEHDQQDLTQDRRAHRRRRSIVRRHHRHPRALHVFPVDPEIAFLAIESLFTRKLLRLASHVRQLVQLRRRLVVRICKCGSTDDGRQVCMMGEREGEEECSET